MKLFLYYKNGGNNADKDSLFLILTPGANSGTVQEDCPCWLELLLGLMIGTADYDMMMTNGSEHTVWCLQQAIVNKLFKVAVRRLLCNL